MSRCRASTTKSPNRLGDSDDRRDEDYFSALRKRVGDLLNQPHCCGTEIEHHHERRATSHRQLRARDCSIQILLQQEEEKARWWHSELLTLEDQRLGLNRI